jgi:hypothetical protein
MSSSLFSSIQKEACKLEVGKEPLVLVGLVRDLEQELVAGQPGDIVEPLHIALAHVHAHPPQVGRGCRCMKIAQCVGRPFPGAPHRVNHGLGRHGVDVKLRDPFAVWCGAQPVIVSLDETLPHQKIQRRVRQFVNVSLDALVGEECALEEAVKLLGRRGKARRHRRKGVDPQGPLVAQLGFHGLGGTHQVLVEDYPVVG